MVNIHSTLDLNDPGAEDFLANLQGNILKPHGRAHITLLLLHFRPGEDMVSSARSWLADCAEKYVTSTKQQLIDTYEHRQNPNSQKLFCMLLISADGYRVLSGYDAQDYESPANYELPPDVGFQLGMKNSLGWSNITDKWEDTYGIHVMVLLAHDEPIQLQKYQIQFTKAVEPFSFVTYEQGDRVTLQENSVQPYEHFGFADGISNPLFIQEDIEKYHEKVGADLTLRWDPATPLDRVLVEEPQKHDDGSKTYGSYMVFYKLEQNLDAFKELYDEEKSLKVFGRQRNGTPLIKPEGSGLNNFNYVDDPNGQYIDLQAHIRQMNERIEQSPRIARRGITYDYGEQGRGVLFMSFQADIQNQFESLVEKADNDTLLSRRDAMNLVKEIFGQYFYAPSLPTLKELARLRNDQRLRFRRAFRALLTKEHKLTEFGKKWQENRAKAATSIGITSDDLATLYAVFRVGDKEAMAGIRQGRRILDEKMAPFVKERGPASKEDVEKLRAALQSLLEPEKLKSFIDTWSKDPEDALKLVDLEVVDAQRFYKLLSDKGVDLDWPLWF